MTQHQRGKTCLANKKKYELVEKAKRDAYENEHPEILREKIMELENCVASLKMLVDCDYSQCRGCRSYYCTNPSDTITYVCLGCEKTFCSECVKSMNFWVSDDGNGEYTLCNSPECQAEERCVKCKDNIGSDGRCLSRCDSE